MPGAHTGRLQGRFEVKVDWKTRLRERAVLVADGAWGTELQRRGLSAGAPPETWNAEQPEEVLAVAAAYVEAGADIVLTNTFGGGRLKLERAGLPDRVDELNRLGVSLSKRAAGTRALVFASIGPTGELLEPLGSLGEREAHQAFLDQATACAQAGADGLLLESLSDLVEALVALHAAREAAAPRGLPVAVTMTFQPGRRGPATVMGTTPQQAAERLAEAGADIVGANCGAGSAEMLAVARAMRGATDRPLWIKPNAGIPHLVGGQTVYPETPEEMAARAAEFVEAGVNVLGGCCGTDHRHVEAIGRACVTH